MQRQRMHLGVTFAAIFTLLGSAALAQPFRGRRVVGNQPGAGGMVNLPYQVQDNAGTTWMIYGAGWMQQQGNMPMYSQAAMLTINQNQPNMNNNQAKVDPKTGEVIFENMPCANISVTRRVRIDREAGLARYIDIIRNPGNAEVNVALMLQTNTNYGIQSAQVMNDPKKKGNNIAWIAQTSGNKTVAEMYSGKGAKQVFTINYQQGNSQVQANMQLSIPAGKEVAVMHLHTTAADSASGQKWVESLKEATLMKEIPPAIRKLIVNFAGGQSFVGDLEILRGELLDIVELRSGDQYRGTIKEATYKLSTFYGPVEIPVERVIGMLNIGDYRPRQLIVTVDGEIFGGRTDKETVSIELSSGQVTQVPLTQVSRIGYRKRTGEPEEWTFEKPIILMRTGDRIGVQTPDYPIELATRYGPLKLQAANIGSISFANEDHGLHQIILADGSKFAGIATADKFDMKLSTNPQQGVSFPASAVARLQITSKIEEPDDATPTITLANDDMLVGTVSGQLKLETAFDTLNVDAAQIRTLRRSKGSVQDVQIALWDDTTISGQLSQSELAVSLRCGVTMKVPIAVVEEYVQPVPRASESMIQRTRELVVELASDDWKNRDRAEKALGSMGPTIVPTLKELRGAANAEVQARIDAVLKVLEKQVGDPKAGKPAGTMPGAAAPGGGPAPAVEILPVPVAPQIQALDR